MHQDAWIILDSPENMKNAFRMSLLNLYVNSSYGNPEEDKPSHCEADEVKWFTVERGEVTLLLRDRPPLKIYTWIWMTDDREQFEMVLQSTAAMTLQESEEWSSHYIKRSFGRTTRRTTSTWATRFVYLQAASSGPGLVQTLVNLKESYTSVTFFYSYCMIPGWKSSKACSPADNVMKWQSLQLWKAPWLRKRWEPAVGSWAGSSLQKHDSYYRNPACNWVDSLIPLVMPASACIHDDSCPTWCVIG